MRWALSEMGPLPGSVSWEWRRQNDKRGVDWLTVPGVTTWAKVACVHLPVMAFLTSFLGPYLTPTKLFMLGIIFSHFKFYFWQFFASHCSWVDAPWSKVTCVESAVNGFPNFLGSFWGNFGLIFSNHPFGGRRNFSMISAEVVNLFPPLFIVFCSCWWF